MASFAKLVHLTAVWLETYGTRAQKLAAQFSFENIEIVLGRFDWLYFREWKVG
jgi:hypothetical protein